MSVLIECLYTIMVFHTALLLIKPQVTARLRQWVAQTRYELLETLLEDLATRLRADFPAIARLRLRVHKPQAAKALGCADVGIEIER